MIKLRQILRLILGKLTQLVLIKHKPDVILVTGNGQTSIVRECIYSILREKYPCRRNLETPEAEFSIPLVVFGEFSYPKSKVVWALLLIKTLVQLIKLKSYKHILIIEASEVNKEIYNFWVNILKPNYLINTPRTIDLTDQTTLYEKIKPLIKDITHNYKIEDNYLQNQINKVNLPQGRIRFEKGDNNSIIIDSRHYYYPTPLLSVVEITTSFEGRKVIFTNIKEDLKTIEEQKLNIELNPLNYKPLQNDVIILRGDRTKFKDLLDLWRS